MCYPFRTIFIGFVFLLSLVEIKGQDCSIPFDSAIFAVQQENDIYYGSVLDYEGNNVDLRLNLFKPIGDDQTERPLVIVIHGGGFFQGDRDDRNAVCYELASKGWAAATISYRLDFYGTWLLPSPFAYDPAEVVRAAYRAQQDVRGAIRFLKGRHSIDSTSTENVMLWGYSAGAIAALAEAFVDEPSDKPASCNEINDVYHLFSNYARPDLGPIEGTLNINGFSDDVLGVVSHYGGMLDTNLISSPLDPALYLYHQTGDPTVGCGHQQGLWNMPLGVGDNYPWLFGSCVIDDHVQNFNPDPLRYNYYEYVGNDHDVHDPPLIFDEATHFLRDLFCPPAIQVAARVFLDGSYDSGTGLMFDSLRSLPSFPIIEPYSDLGYDHVNGGTEVIDASTLSTTGNNAIVDWVVVELRDPLDPTVIIETRSGLLQRDGDIVGIDGISNLFFNLPPDNYHIAVRHRNHLGVMTAASVPIGDQATLIDFTDTATVTYGTNAQKTIGSINTLWAGDATFNAEVKYTGAGNDRDAVLTAIGGIIPTNTISAYRTEDINLDGTVKYTGSENDRDIILETIGGISPTAVRSEQLP